MELWKEVYLQIIIILSNIIQIIAGFGGNMIAIPLTINLFDFSDIKMVLNTFSNIGCIVLLFQTFREVNRKEFLKMTFGMLAGMAIGWVIMAKVSLDFLLPVYAGFVMVVGITKLFGKKETNLPKKYLNVVILIAGIIHGMFLSGGCMLVIYAMSALKDKKEFRATLNAVWVVTGTLWMGYDFILGNYTEVNVIRSLVGIATLAISIPVGNFLFKKLNQQKFLKLTYVLVILAGVTMLL